MDPQRKGFGYPAWFLQVTSAIAILMDGVLTLRFMLALDCAKFCCSCTRCSDIPEPCSTYHEMWSAIWCLFLEALGQAAKSLPREGRVVSALNTSVATLITENLPSQLATPMTSMADGTGSLALGVARVAWVQETYLQYLDAALLLGAESLRFGRQRVQQAVFHEDAADAGFEDSVQHRGDVLLWALHESSRRKEVDLQKVVPLVGEVGVHIADNARHLLERHRTLRWIGVDAYYDGSGPAGADFNGRGVPGATYLNMALRNLKPWLSSRAHLIIGDAATPDVMVVEPGPYDLVYIDGDHSYHGARKDLSIWAPRVRSEGVVAGHDYTLNFPGVVDAAHERLPAGATLHLGPAKVFWWYLP